jgi:hypothetical protein
MVYGVLSFFSVCTNLSTSGVLLVGAGVGRAVFGVLFMGGGVGRAVVGAVFGVLFMGGGVFGDGRPPDALVVPSCAAIFIAAAVLAGVLRLAIAARSIFAAGEAPKTLVPLFIGILISFTSSWIYRLRSVRWR